MNERALQIIELLTHHIQGLSGQELSSRIGVSVRTVRSDIRSVSSQLEQHGASIRSTARYGYRIEIADQAAYESFRCHLKTPPRTALATADERLRALLRRLLYNALQNRQITQAQLADELFVSLSTLKLLLRDAVKKLEKYRLRIAAYKNKGIQVDGDEAQIRYCISEYIVDHERSAMSYTDPFYQTLFPAIELSRIGDILLQVVARREINLTDTAMQNLLLHTAIAVQRALSQHPMIYTAGQVKRIEEEPEFAVARDLAERIYQELTIDIAIGEVYYIAQHLIASKKYAGALPRNAKPPRTKMIEHILNKIRRASNIDFGGDEDLISGLTVHLNVAIPRMKFQMNMRNEALELIKKEYPLAFQLGVIAGSVIEEQERVRVSENEIGFIAVHFGAALSRMGIDCGAEQKRALVVCANGIGMAILIKTKLKNYFRSRIEVVQTVAGYQLTPAKIAAVDLVLTTVPLPRFKSDKIINIRRLLSDDEIADIEQRVFGKIVDKEILPAFFRRDCFYCNLQFQTKWEILEFLTQSAMEKHLMNEATKASVLEREEASSTEIGNLVAIPHSMISEMDVSSISVLLLKKPILWDVQQVQVVFLINIAKDQFALWEPVFLKLFDYLVKENGVKSMLRESSYDAFICNFMQKF